MNPLKIFFMNSKVLKAEKIISFQWMKQNIISNMKIVHFCNVVHPCKEYSGLLCCFGIDLFQFAIDKVFYGDNHLVSVNLIPVCILPVGMVDSRCFNAVFCKQNGELTLCSDSIQSDIGFIFETNHNGAAGTGFNLYNQTHFLGIGIIFLIMISLQLTKAGTMLANAIIPKDTVNIIYCNREHE